jgi:hypothetical protein
MRLLISLFSLILFVFFWNAAQTRAANCTDIYFNKDARSFFPQFPPPANSTAGILGYNYADLNNDGNLDVVANVRTGGEFGQLITFLGDGHGKFQPGSTTTLPNFQVSGFNTIKFVHINNDAAVDLVTFGGANVGIFFGDNNGGFTFHSVSQVFSIFPFCCIKLLDVFDINGDGRKDIVVQEIGPKSGNVFLAYVLSTANYDFPTTRVEFFSGAKSVLIEDFNKDGRKDIVGNFFNFAANKYELKFYYNQGNGSFTPGASIGFDNTTTLKLAYDFDNNGWEDFVATTPDATEPSVTVLYNYGNQELSIVKYPSARITRDGTIFDVNDFNGDGLKDFAAFTDDYSQDSYNIYLRKRAGGFSHSVKNIFISPISVGSFYSDRALLIGDFNNDRKADILRLGTNAFFRNHAFQLYRADCFRRGRPDTIDYIGNGLPNLASWEPTSGRWTYKDTSYMAPTYTAFWGSGALGDVPVPGDYDGDGVTDTAVFRRPTGTWYVNATTEKTISFQFGENGDKPVPADYDGDFKTDFAVFRAATNDWLVWLSGTQRLSITRFGENGDKPVPADFDGDDKADLAVYRPSNGTWYYLRSSNNALVTFQFGQAGDTPQPTDMDGDGRADFNVFNPTNSVFYFASSFDGRNSFVSRGMGGIPQPTSGFFMNGLYNYRTSDGAWIGESIITQTPPNEIPVTYVLPVGN